MKNKDIITCGVLAFGFQAFLSFATPATATELLDRLLTEGEVAMNHGNFALAKSKFETVMSLAPSIKVEEQFGALYYVWGKSLADDPNLALEKLEVACYFRSSDEQIAAELSKQIMKLGYDPNKRKDREELAFLANKRGSFSGAAAEYQAALTLEDNPHDHMVLGRCLRILDKYDAARNQCEVALKDSSISTEDQGLALQNLSQCYQSLGKKDSVEEVQRKINALPRVESKWNRDLRKQKEANEFSKHLDNATALDSRQLYAASIHELESALKLAPETVDILYRLGVANSKNGKYESAIEYFKRVLTLEPAHAAAQQGLKNAISRLTGRP